MGYVGSMQPRDTFGVDLPDMPLQWLERETIRFAVEDQYAQVTSCELELTSNNARYGRCQIANGVAACIQYPG